MAHFVGTELSSHHTHTVNQGQGIQSPNHQFNAIIQHDGNFVLYDAHHHPHWASNTNGHGHAPYRLTLQQDGNLVVYDHHNHPTWASNTNGKGRAPYTLKLQNDRNLVLYDADLNATWSSNTHVAGNPHSLGHFLRSHDHSTLQQDHHITSWNDQFRAVIQHDGNFVLYDIHNHPFWATNTNGKGHGPYRVVLQADGNLVLYDHHGHAHWASNTNGHGHGPYRLVLQDDRNLVLYDHQDRPTWASNTHH